MHENGNKEIGKLSDVLLQKNNLKLYGIISTNKGMIYSNRLIKAGVITKVYSDKIVVSDKGERFVRVPPEDNFISFKQGIDNKNVFDKMGNSLGIVRNASFDTEFGCLEELEIGHGFTDDLLRGRELLTIESLSSKEEALEVASPQIKKKDKGLQKLLKGRNLS